MRALVLAVIISCVAGATPAAAFCGFYVAGASDAAMVNDATHVVLVRKGARTVLAMQNAYKGPLQDFALVVPVPAVLHDGDVKTLPRDVFAHVERMGAPRLVEYWERDPCALEQDTYLDLPKPGAAPTIYDAGAPVATDLGITIEARFTVAEYQITILSAKDSAGLAAYLEQEHYKIPAGAAPLLRPYVESGMKFFLAKVDPQKVAFEGGRAVLSPLRFHYDADDFTLPIRLGLANSAGTQDLIVDILAPHQRYQVANYPNVTIPTNLDLAPSITGEKFAAFYAALFDRTIEKNPRAVVTEYAWQATTCDPCPGPALDATDFLTLGADVLEGPSDKPSPYVGADFVLTRMHARYGTDVTDDLRFTLAEPITGGRETTNASGRLDDGAAHADVNNFQARYAIRHPWTGAIACDAPKRGIWGGPPNPTVPPPAPQAAVGLALAPRGDVALASAVVRDIPALDVRAGAAAAVAAPSVTASAAQPKRSGCGCATGGGGGGADGGAIVIVMMLVVTKRRRQA